MKRCVVTVALISIVVLPFAFLAHARVPPIHGGQEWDLSSADGSVGECDVGDQKRTGICAVEVEAHRDDVGEIDILESGERNSDRVQQHFRHVDDFAGRIRGDDARAVELWEKALAANTGDSPAVTPLLTKARQRLAQKRP